MSLFKNWTPLVLATSVMFATACSVQAEEMSKEAIERIVHEYILENPEIIADAIYLLQARAEEDKAKQESSALQEMQMLLTDNELDPVGGNPDGDITIVEFFDYNCGYCKRASPVLQTLVKNNPNLKVVYKEWPILSESSSTAARIALAVNLVQPEKYEELHHALLSSRSLRSDNDVWKIAESVGVDRKLVEPKLNSPEINLHIQQSTTLAQSLGITGTPAFIVGDKIMKGAYPIEQIQQAIDSQS
jgi:protein-disulfide isomerase